MGDTKLTLLNFIMNKVEFNLNMFHGRVEDWIYTKMDGANIVTIDGR